ncbi:MAG: helix-turn-helix domain-containing protein [Phycisphaerales bacterium]
MSPIPRLRLKSFVPAGGWFHLARAAYRPGRTCAVHRHDFCEICWVEAGQAMHLINGRRQTLPTGALTWIRPDDAHGYRTIGGRGFALVNLAFDVSVMDDIRRRYFADRHPWPWAGDAMPAERTLSAGQLAQLAADVDGLSMLRQSRLDLEWFVLGLLRMFEARSVSMPSHGDVPRWLEQSLAGYVESCDYQSGPVEFAASAGRSVEHVNRTVRRCYGQTTTDLLNGLRLDHAAKMLRMTGEPIVDVAPRSGFNNLGYFYRQFQRKFGLTPRRYRLKMHAVMR